MNFIKHKLLLLLCLLAGFSQAMGETSVIVVERTRVKLPLTGSGTSNDSISVIFSVIKSRDPIVWLGDGNSSVVSAETRGSLTIPSSIEYRGKTHEVKGVFKNAFAGCENITSVTFSSGISTYESPVFINCNKLKSITFQGDIDSLASDMIVECGSLEQVKFNGGLSLYAIPRGFLSGCQSLRYIYFPASLQEIGDEAFMNCNSLSQISLPSKLKHLGSKAFYGCSKLQSFTLPDSLLTIGDSVVAGITALRYVDMRKATSLELADSVRLSPVLANLSDHTIVYLPKGKPCTGETNVIETDTTGVMSCAHFVVDEEELTPEQCMRGEATYKINKFFGGTTFRQELGVDNFPIPSSAYLLRVYRVTFWYEDSLRTDRYVNTGKTIQLPDHEEMEISYSTLAYYYQYAGKKTAFTNKVGVNQDTRVDVELKRVKYDANGDGNIDVQDITAVINAIIGNESESFYEFNADVDNNGAVNVLDVTMIINKILSGDYHHLIDGGLNILALGNSFMCDAFSYVPYILQESMPDVNVYFGMLNHGAGSLRNHYIDHMVNKEPYEVYYAFDNVGFWHTSAKDVVTVDSVLASRQWDIILLQQLSNQSANYANYQPHLNSLLDSLQVKAPGAVCGWLLTPSFADGYLVLGEDNTSDSMYSGIADCSQRVLNETLVKFVIPGGTAIQNARHTMLDSVGTFGHLTVDGRHLQDGLPCLIEGLTVAQVLANFLDLEAPAEDVDLPVTESWATSNNIPQFASPVVGMTESEIQLGKECMKAAVQNPFEITLLGDESGGEPDGGGGTE